MSGRQVLDQALSLNSSVSGAIQDCLGMLAFTVVCKITGTAPTGTLSLQFSIDGTVFIEIPTQTVAVAGVGNFEFLVDPKGYDKFRIEWVFTSGTGSLDADLGFR